MSTLQKYKIMNKETEQKGWLTMKNLKCVQKKTEIKVGKSILGMDFVVIAGPCSVESEKQICNIAEGVSLAGATMLRGGAYKPRTSPYAFQGLGEEGLRYLRKAGDMYDLAVVTEVMDTRDVPLVSRYADVLQIGTRNMQNYALLKEVGRTDMPVLLKRGMGATIEEWLNSAEYILAEGNPNVILCERGIRTFETYTRNTLDVGAIAVGKRLSGLPILADPSHATGKSELVEPMALSAIMAGCDGLEIEVHDEPMKALSDNEQQLDLQQFAKLMQKIQKTYLFREQLMK